jgi:NADPH:quinone reductase-like Zn-dependent oxidoreductase
VEVLRELADGRLRVPIFEILPLQSAPEAHRRILARSVTGKLLLQP